MALKFPGAVFGEDTDHGAETGQDILPRGGDIVFVKDTCHGADMAFRPDIDRFRP